MAGTASSYRARKSPGVRGGSEDLAQEIQQLLTLDATALRKKWATLFGAEPSPHLGRVLMIRAIAYRFQKKAFGGLKPSVQRVLNRVCYATSAEAQKHIPTRRVGAGTVSNT